MRNWTRFLFATLVLLIVASTATADPIKKFCEAWALSGGDGTGCAPEICSFGNCPDCESLSSEPSDNYGIEVIVREIERTYQAFNERPAMLEVRNGNPELPMPISVKVEYFTGSALSPKNLYFDYTQGDSCAPEYCGELYDRCYVNNVGYLSACRTPPAHPTAQECYDTQTGDPRNCTKPNGIIAGMVYEDFEWLELGNSCRCACEIHKEPGTTTVFGPRTATELNCRAFKYCCDDTDYGAPSDPSGCGGPGGGGDCCKPPGDDVWCETPVEPVFANLAAVSFGNNCYLDLTHVPLAVTFDDQCDANRGDPLECWYP